LIKVCPGNSCLASGYAANEAKRTCPAVPIAVTKTVLYKYRDIGICVFPIKLNNNPNLKNIIEFNMEGSIKIEPEDFDMSKIPKECIIKDLENDEDENLIDKDKKHLNYELHNENNIVYQKEIDLKIKDRYKGKKSIRKDAVLNIECLITSDKEFFDRIGAEETKRYFEEAYNFIKNKFGEENLIYATVHMDETTPHMHAGFVPITTDGRLSAKDYLDGKERLRNLQDDFHKYISSKGFELERGISSDETHAKNIILH